MSLEAMGVFGFEAFALGKPAFWCGLEESCTAVVDQNNCHLGYLQRNGFMIPGRAIMGGACIALLISGPTLFDRSAISAQFGPNEQRGNCKRISAGFPLSFTRRPRRTEHPNRFRRRSGLGCARGSKV